MKYVVRFQRDRRDIGLRQLLDLDEELIVDEKSNPITSWITTTLSLDDILNSEYVKDAFLATEDPKGIVRGREFDRTFMHPNCNMRNHPNITSFRIEAVQEWIERETGEITLLHATDWDLHEECPYSEDHEVIGEIKYLLIGHGEKPSKTNITRESRLASFNVRIGIFKSLKAALDTLVDMGIIDAGQRKDTLHIYKLSKTRPPQPEYRGD